MVLVCSSARRQKHERTIVRKLQSRRAATHLGNEYFDNAAKGKNKAAEWVGYISPSPLNL